MEHEHDTSDLIEDYFLPREKVSFISVEGYKQVKLFRSVKDKSGPWILFLHGLTFYTDICAAFLNKLSRRHNVLSFDWPGVGGTDPPHKNVYTPQELLSFAEKVVEAAEPGLPSRDLSIVGHSMGGLMSLILGTHYVKQGFDIKNVIMLAPAGVKVHKWMIHRLLTTPVIGPIMNFIFKRFPDATAKRTVYETRYNFHYMPKHMEEALWEPFQKSMLRNTKITAARILAFAQFPWENYRKLFVELDESKVNAIVVLAGRDVTIDTPVTEHFLRTNCPSISVQVYPDYTHDLVACNADVMAEYISAILP